MKILVTGGHLGPALACIDELKKKDDVELVFVGRKYNSLQEKTLSLEYREIEKRNIPFYHLFAGRLGRALSLQNFVNVLYIPFGFIHAKVILLKERPDMILSFGSYMALPIAIIGKLLGAKIYTHEQTIHPGLANRIIGRFAEKVFISFPESASFFPKQKTVVTGNPIKTQVFEVLSTPFTIEKKPVIYVTGGSLGAHSINVHIKNIIEPLLLKYTVIHQTGNIAEFGDFKTLTQLRERLKKELRERYILREHIQSDEIGYVYSVADLVVGRAGANTFFELVALHKPSVLIPLPWSADDEQKKQANALAEAGVAEVFYQEDDSNNLLTLIEKVITDLPRYKENFMKLANKYPTHAAETITKEILQH